MARKNTGKKSDLLWLRIVLWPFKIIFLFISWILRVFFEGIIELIEHVKKKNMERESKSTIKSTSKYAPFKIIEPLKGDFKNFEKFLITNPSTIGIILGARGTGKSAIGLKLLENIHEKSKKNFYAMGFKQDDIPEWIHTINKLEDIETDSFVLIDEGGILFSARESFSDANKLLSELLLIARHKDLSVIFISQNSANLEINAIRQTDYLILKPSSLLQMDFERKKIKEIYETAHNIFHKHKNIRGITYIYSTQFRGFVSNPLPSFWSQNISKSFRNKKKE